MHNDLPLHLNKGTYHEEITGLFVNLCEQGDLSRSAMIYLAIDCH